MTGPQPTRTVLVAVNPFKGSLTAVQVAEACARGARAVGWSVDLMPASDGGDGLLDALRAAGLVGRTTSHRVAGPAADPVSAEVDWLDPRTAVIESRFVVGLGLVPPSGRDPGVASTRGLGELIAEVGRAGADRVLVGLGGSATMDGGIGMAAAWGWSFLDPAGDPLDAVGANLDRLGGVQAGAPPATELTGLVDVEHALLGPEGAGRFAEQKGATRAQTDRLESGLVRLVGMLGARAEGLASVAGAGAAGGLGFGLACFGKGRLVRGSVWMLDRLGFAERLRRVDAVLTAEGGFDDTSQGGKLTGEVIRLAQAAGLPVGLLAPTARGVPAGVPVETGGGRWDAVQVEQRAAVLTERLGRLPPP